MWKQAFFKSNDKHEWELETFRRVYCHERDGRVAFVVVLIGDECRMVDELTQSFDALFVVVNRHHSGDVVTLQDAQDVLGRDVFWTIPNDYRAFSDALTRGRPVTERDAGSALTKAYVQLAAKLGGKSDASPMNGTRPAETGSRLSRLLRRGK